MQKAKPAGPLQQLTSTGSFDGDFSLRKVIYLMPKYAPPPVGKFEPTGAWTHDYTMYVMQGPTHMVGDVSLKRIPKGKSDFTLEVAIRRRANSGFSQFEQAQFQCRADDLATPSTWLFDTKMAENATDKPYLQSGRRRSGMFADGTLSIRDGVRMRKESIKGRLANEWALLEAVQRLPGGKTNPLDFTLVDHFDVPEPGHSLAFHTQEEVEFMTGSAKLTSYLGTGPGIVPTVYWTDEHQRLIFVCTGLKVYALNATDGQTGQCPNSYPPYGRQGVAVEE